MEKIDETRTSKRRYGERRLRLNKEEREIVKRNELIASVIEQLDALIPMPEISRKLGVDESVLHQLFREDQEVRARVINLAVRMYLDVDRNHRTAEIARACGLSEKQLHDLIKTKEFEEAYSQYFFDLMSSPRLRAIQQAVVDQLLPMAYKSLYDILADPETSPSVKAKVAIEILNKSGIKIEARENDRRELAKFLQSRNITVNLNMVNLPDEYSKAMQDYDEIIDSTLRELGSGDTTSLQPHEEAA